MRREGTKIFRRSLWLVAALCFAMFSLPAMAAAPLVVAHYSQKDATTGVLQLTVADPAPSSVIVSLNLPEGYDILSASPEFKKRSKKPHEIKWLLKDVSPGTSVVTFTLSAPFSFSQLGCIVQYMNSGDGRMITLRVTN